MFCPAASGNVTSIVGRNVTLSCRVKPGFKVSLKAASNLEPTMLHYVHFSQVAWIKESTRTILSSHERLVTQSNRYSVVTSDGGDVVRLRINNVTRRDEGKYICQANTDPITNTVHNDQKRQKSQSVHGQSTQIVRLNVNMSPRFSSEGQDVVKARKGEDVVLRCDAEGVPTPKIKWYSNVVQEGKGE